MARRQDQNPLRKIAGAVGDWGTLLLQLKNSIFHPEDALTGLLFNKLKEIGREDNRLRGMIRGRVQFYNRRMRKWIVVNTENGKYLRASRNKYKNIREV